MISQPQSESPFVSEFSRFVADSRTPDVRTPLEFAEQELVIPDGRWRTFRFKTKRQPWQRLWLNELANPHWLSLVLCGPTQSAKTYAGVVIPLTYHLAELRESVGFGVPDLNMCNNKWKVDLEPSFVASEMLFERLPTSGEGSAGGKVKSEIMLATGEILKFFTPGGKDESKSGFTLRVMVVTEAKGFSVSVETSDEAPPLEQLRGRLRAYERDQRREYIEGTVGTESNYPWSLREDSSKSEIYTQCPRCKVWSVMGRTDLKGWQEAETEEQAAQWGRFFCPACDHPITNDERFQMNSKAKLLHDGQTIDKRGRISGQMPDTRRLFFHYSAFHNMFNKPGDFATEEWKGAQAPDNTEAKRDQERKNCQQIWSIPYEEPIEDVNPLNIKNLRSHIIDWQRKILLDGHNAIVLGCDPGMYDFHFVAISFQLDTTLEHPNARRYHVCDYGIKDVLPRGIGTAESRRKQVGVRLREVIAEFDKAVHQTWFNRAGEYINPSGIWVDAKYRRDDIFAGCKKAGAPWFPYFGRGVGSGTRETYKHPERYTRYIVYIGEQYNFRIHQQLGMKYGSGNADYWKSQVHESCNVNLEQSFALSFFRDDKSDPHGAYFRQLLSEKEVWEDHPKFGMIRVWELDHTKRNHYLDSTYIGLMNARHQQIAFARKQKASGWKPASSKQVTSQVARRRRIR